MVVDEVALLYTLHAFIENDIAAGIWYSYRVRVDVVFLRKYRSRVSKYTSRLRILTSIRSLLQGLSFFPQRFVLNFGYGVLAGRFVLVYD